MKPHIGVAALLLTATALVACGGGGGGSFVAPPPSGPSSTTASAALSTSATTSVALPTIANGSSAKVTLPAANAAANASLTLQATLPSGAAKPQAMSMAKAPSEIGGSNITVLDYVVLTVDQAITISQTPAFSFTLPTAVTGNAYIAFFDVNNASNGWTTILGPGTSSGTTISFASQTLVPSLSLVPKDVYVFALFTATAVATPTPVPTYPGAAGSSYSFSGTQTQNDTYTYPSNSPLPSTSSSATVTETVSVATSPVPYPSGTPAVRDLHEVLAVAGPLSTSSTTTDAWYGAALSGTSAAIGLYGFKSTDDAGNAMTTLYTSPQIVDLAPEANGSWSNSIAGTTSGTFADGQTLARTDNADTSFTETTTQKTLSHTYTFILAGKTDGSGSYTGTGIAALGLDAINASAPSSGTITISLAVTGQTTPFVLATPAAWFTPSGKLYTESDTSTTNVAYPSTCSVPSQFGFNGTHVAQTIERIDPMIGTDEKIVNDTYTGAVGPVCMTMSDTLTENYDWLNDTFDAAYNFADWNGKHVVKIAQTLTLQNATIKASAGKSAQALSPTAISAARAQFAMKVAQQRHRLINAFVKRVETKIQNGGHK